jgi:hypothetical protein
MWSLYRTAWDLNKLMATAPKPEPIQSKTQPNTAPAESKVQPMAKPQQI